MPVACGYGFRSGVDRWCSVSKIRESLRCVVDGVNTGQHRSGGVAGVLLGRCTITGFLLLSGLTYKFGGGDQP